MQALSSVSNQNGAQTGLLALHVWLPGPGQGLRLRHMHQLGVWVTACVGPGIEGSDSLRRERAPGAT